MRWSKSFFLLAVFLPFLIVIAWGQALQDSKNTDDSCVGCHTNSEKMKSLITKFPEPLEEEGEG